VLNVKKPESVLPYTGIRFFARAEMGWGKDKTGEGLLLPPRLGAKRNILTWLISFHFP
jgi:hypothetical protein